MLTLGVTGAGCRTVTIFEGYRQVSTGTVADLAVAHRGPDPGEPADPRRAGRRAVRGHRGGGGHRPTGPGPTSLLGLRITDGSEVWRRACDDGLTVRFALVPAGDDPAKGHITEEGETVPQVLVGCAGNVRSLDPQTGRDRV